MEFAIIDFETTGLCAEVDRVIEVGVVRMREDKAADSFSRLMNPGYAIPPFITSLTGITNAMLRNQPPPEAVMPELRRFLGDCPCIAHNAAFDSRFFFAEMARAGLEHERPFFCTMRLSRRLVPDAPNHQLGTLVRHLRLETAAGNRAHRALDDALVTATLWGRLLRIFGDRTGKTPEPELLQTLATKPKKAVDAYLRQLAAQTATPHGRTR